MGGSIDAEATWHQHDIGSRDVCETGVDVLSSARADDVGDLAPHPDESTIGKLTKRKRERFTLIR